MSLSDLLDPYFTNDKLVKLSKNKKGRKNFLLHRFLNPFLQLAAEKKDSKKRCR